uniref:Uncharacterized protein n=1 Tax=Arundo donax TaxID=35708 RepID=A0A0A9CZD8_ARUDO
MRKICLAWLWCADALVTMCLFIWPSLIFFSQTFYRLVDFCNRI